MVDAFIGIRSRLDHESIHEEGLFSDSESAELVHRLSMCTVCQNFKLNFAAGFESLHLRMERKNLIQLSFCILAVSFLCEGEIIKVHPRIVWV